MFSFFCNLSYNQTILSASTLFKRPAVSPVWHFYCCQNNDLRQPPRGKQPGDLNPRLPGDPWAIWEPTACGGSSSCYCFKSSCETSVYPPPFHPLPVISSLSSPQLRPVYVHLVASRVQTAEGGKIDLTHLSFILMTFWNTFTPAEQTGFFFFFFKLTTVIHVMSRKPGSH